MSKTTYTVDTVSSAYESILKVPVEDRKRLFLSQYLMANSKIETDCRWFANVMEDARKVDPPAWTLVGCKTFEEFCEKKLRRKPTEVRLIMAGVRMCDQGQPLPSHQAIQAAVAREQAETIVQGRHHKQLKVKPGSTASYLLRRLARHNPSILDRYEKGDFPSVRAAAIAAGIVKPKTPLQLAQAAYKKLSLDERTVFLNWTKSLP